MFQKNYGMHIINLSITKLRYRLKIAIIKYVIYVFLQVNNTGQETFVKLDISKFMPYFRGQLLEVGPILNSGCITSFGIQVGGGVYEKFKQKGVSSLVIDQIWAIPHHYPGAGRS